MQFIIFGSGRNKGCHVKVEMKAIQEKVDNCIGLCFNDYEG